MPIVLDEETLISDNINQTFVEYGSLATTFWHFHLVDRRKISSDEKLSCVSTCTIIPQLTSTNFLFINVTTLQYKFVQVLKCSFYCSLEINQ